MLHALTLPFQTLDPSLVAAALAGGRDALPSHARLSELAAARGVVTASGHRVRFVPQAPKPRRGRKRASDDLPYEALIHATGDVPTRAAHWHDFFNALVWCRFPLAKAALNERQCRAAEFATATDSERAQVRTREQDRLAMFDEGGAVLVRAPDGERLAFVFGHAILEAVVGEGRAPDYMALTLELSVDAGFFAAPLEAQLAGVDARIAALVAGGVFRDGVGAKGRPLVEVLGGGARGPE